MVIAKTKNIIENDIAEFERVSFIKKILFVTFLLIKNAFSICSVKGSCV